MRLLDPPELNISRIIKYSGIFELSVSGMIVISRLPKILELWNIGQNC